MAMLPWISTPECADQVGRHRTVVLRHLTSLMKAGLVSYRWVGLPPNRLQRWLLCSDGVYEVFPDRHRHRTASEMARHQPFWWFKLGVEQESHSHPSLWNSEAGAEALYGFRLHLIQSIYPVAIGLFKGKRASHHPDRIEARLLGYRWLSLGGQGRRLYVAVGEYEGGVVVFFGWIPRTFNERMLRHRWNNRTRGLLYFSEASLAPVDYETPPDPADSFPWPSLHVFIAEDFGAVVLSWRALVEKTSDYLVPIPLLRYLLSHGIFWPLAGEIRPSRENLWDPFRDVDLGDPGALCEPIPVDEDDDE